MALNDTEKVLVEGAIKDAHEIANLQVVNKKISAFADARLLEIDTKNHDIEKLQAENRKLEKRISLLIEELDAAVLRWIA